MDRARVTLPALLGLVGLVLVLPHLDLHGFWFDEAYTARLAALEWPRLLSGAQQDIHPPGWPILAGLLLRLPLAAEWALRLPAALCFAALVALISARNRWAGVALLLYAPLVEQAGQGRPYVPLALGLVAITRLIEARRWGVAGMVVAVVASLHALGGVLCVAALFATIPFQRPGWRDLLRLLVPPIVVSAAWLPGFVSSAATYVRSPWYNTASLADLWIVTDGGGAAVAALFVLVAAALDRNLRAAAPAAVVVASLVAMELAGVGVEIRKTGIVLLPLLLAGLGSSRHARIAGLASVGALGATSIQLPARPDLREAHTAAEELGNIPVISVFASEAAWYFRSPAPLPSGREPGAIATRIAEATGAQGAQCLISIALPSTFPMPDTLPPGLRTILVADVTGLDVRLIGTEECPVDATGRWHRPAP